MIEELFDVLQHGSAEPRADLRSVAINRKYHESAVTGKKRLDPSKQLMHLANLRLADNQKAAVKCPHHRLILVTVHRQKMVEIERDRRRRDFAQKIRECRRRTGQNQ